MTDQIMMELAKMQSKIRGYELDQKKYVEQLHERDREINELNKKIGSLEMKDNMIAKNQSYLELKALKDREQIKENNKLKEGNNDQAKSKPGRSTTK